METKEQEKDSKQIIIDKLIWEPPKLIFLDKSKTFGGEPTPYLETTMGVGS